MTGPPRKPAEASHAASWAVATKASSATAPGRGHWQLPQSPEHGALPGIMTSMATTARSRSLTMAQQALGLRSVFPDSSLTLKPGRLSWTGRLQPCDLSRIYTVQITYTRGHYPAVRVLAPELKSGRERIPAPHIRQRNPLPA